MLGRPRPAGRRSGWQPVAASSCYGSQWHGSRQEGQRCATVVNLDSNR
jgi:hypothetical protein